MNKNRFGLVRFFSRIQCLDERRDGQRRRVRIACDPCIHTHFSFIFERVIATIPNAMEMRCPLAGKAAIVGTALFGRAKTLKTIAKIQHRQFRL